MRKAMILIAASVLPLLEAQERGAPYASIIPRTKVYQSPNCGSMIPLTDGRIMWVWGVGGQRPQPYALQANFSSDGGRSWSDPASLKQTDGSDVIGFLSPSLARLKSGRIGLAQEHAVKDFNGYAAEILTAFHTSDDEGRTWSKGVRINPPEGRDSPYFDQLTVLSSGRLIIPFMHMVGPTPRDREVNFFTLFGQKFRNAYAGNMITTTAYYSDDEGRTWQRSFNEVYASIDRGLGGNYNFMEFGLAELPDGRVLMLAFTALGRIFRSYSNDGGKTWNEAEPTDLQGTGPMSVKRIPGSNEVLLTWCQGSQWELMTGLNRHRLSCAITSDGGLTFHSFHNLESLDDVTRIEPEPLRQILAVQARQPIDTVRYHRAPGPLRVDHPFCTFHNGNAVIGYGIGTPGDLEFIKRYYHVDVDELCMRFGFEPRKSNPKVLEGSNKVQVVPLEWLRSK